MEEARLTYGKSLAVWWAYGWRAVILSGLAGLVVGAVGGFNLGMAGANVAIPLVCGTLGILVSVPVSIWSMKGGVSFRSAATLLLQTEDVIGAELG